ncbi:MAG: PAS domain-containing sensor histidine kinase [Peptostreptococcaceae bacterium]
MKDQIYRQLIEDSPMAYAHLEVTWKDDGSCKSAKLLDINESFEKNFGTIKERVIGKDIKQHLDEASGFDLISVLKKTVNSKNVTTRYSYKNNENLNIEVYNFEQNEYHIRLTKISNESNIMSTILRKSPFIAWIKDRNGNYIDVNEKYLELLNAKYEDIIGRCDEELWAYEISSKFEKMDKAVIRDNKPYIFDEIIDIGDSKTRYLETINWPYTSKDGSVILGTMGISIEVTDKLKLREAIEINEKNFLDIANNIHQLIIIRDEKKALYVSPYFEELYGFKPDELYEDMNKWYEYWDKVEFIGKVEDYNSKKILNNIFRVVKEGKIDKWIHCKTTPILDGNGDLLRKVVILNDITDKIKIEDEIESLRMEFFSNLSHELRTPINLITSTLQVISPRVDTLDKDDKEYIHKYLDILNQNALRLIKLVNNLIDTTKIDSGNFDYSPKNQDIISFVENICTSVVEFVEQNGLEIIFDTDTEEKIVGFDLDHMERIILNLISNAIKFNKENGKIEINISTKDNIVISVKDEGIGIPKDKQESIFGRFEQVNKKMKKEREGSGIGLSLVSSLVKMHNGNIKLKSKLGEGSEFLITLPDVLVNEDNNIEFENIPPYLNKLNKLEVEFSDIYA